MRDRGQLERDLRTSRAIRTRVAWLGVTGVVVTLGCAAAGAPGMITFAAAAITAITTGGGLWITQAHIEDFAQQLRSSRNVRAPAQRGGVGVARPANGELRRRVPRDRSSAA